MQSSIRSISSQAVCCAFACQSKSVLLPRVQKNSPVKAISNQMIHCVLMALFAVSCLTSENEYPCGIRIPACIQLPLKSVVSIENLESVNSGFEKYAAHGRPGQRPLREISFLQQSNCPTRSQRGTKLPDGTDPMIKDQRSSDQI